MDRKSTCEKLNVHYLTLYSMAERGEIETVTVGKRQKYNVEKYLKDHSLNSFTTRRKVCYCRVSNKNQNEYLTKQIEEMKINYPSYEIISDIANGLSHNREGLQKILDYIIKGELELLVISHKDRLSKFGYEMIEWMMKEYSRGTILILNNSNEKTPPEEIADDILSVMNIHVTKVKGLRKYVKKIKDVITTNGVQNLN